MDEDDMEKEARSEDIELTITCIQLELLTLVPKSDISFDTHLGDVA